VAGSVALADFDDRPDATERQVRALSTLRLNHPPGTKWEYSNLNYNILGLILEVVSGESYAGYIQNHIYDPLGMRHSYTSRKEAKPNGLAMGHRHWFSLPFPARELPIPRGSLPSGQLISNAEDMAHYLIAHLNEGRYGDVQILSEAGVQELHRGAAEFSMGSAPVGRYAMGWFDMDIGQTKTFSHSGNVPDFSAFMALLPEQKRGVVLLLNADPYGLPLVTEEIGAGLMALLAGQPPPPVKLDFIQWIMRLLPLIPILQIVDIFATLRSIRNWRKDPQLRPSAGRVWWKHILPALIPNLALAALLGYLRSSGLLRFVQFFMPDLAWITRICGGFGAIWVFLRTGLILKVLRK
jgi:CubicO group peptidase (beta-lactamase class C family)